MAVAVLPAACGESDVGGDSIEAMQQSVDERVESASAAFRFAAGSSVNRLPTWGRFEPSKGRKETCRNGWKARTGFPGQPASQFLPVKLLRELPGRPASRSYSISGCPRPGAESRRAPLRFAIGAPSPASSIFSAANGMSAGRIETAWSGWQTGYSRPTPFARRLPNPAFHWKRRVRQANPVPCPPACALRPRHGRKSTRIWQASSVGEPTVYRRVQVSSASAQRPPSMQRWQSILLGQRDL